MIKILETVMRVLMREHRFGSFEAEVTTTRTPLCEIHVKRGVEYIVRGKTGHHGGTLELYLRTSAGAVIPIFALSGGFTFIADEDGVCRVWGNIRANGTKNARSQAVITVSNLPPPPKRLCRSAGKGTPGANSYEPSTLQSGGRVFRVFKERSSSSDLVHW